MCPLNCDRKTCSSQRFAKASFRPIHLISKDFPQLGLWFRQSGVTLSLVSEINTNYGHHLDMQVQLRILFGPVLIKPGQHVLCKDAQIVAFRDAAKGRKPFSRQDGSFKGLVNILWLFSFTTTTSGLQEQTRQKAYIRSNPNSFRIRIGLKYLKMRFCLFISFFFFFY